MTDRNDLHLLKTLAKQYARANRLPHHKALDLVAVKLGFPHWKALSSAAKGNWLPGPEQLANIKAFVRRDDKPTENGSIGSYSFWIEDALDDVHIFGRGWHIQIGEAPSLAPVIEVTDKRIKSNPIHDPEFVKEALNIANARAERVRARISSDWPRRSTKPDVNGRARHPISGGLSEKWFCLHCDGKFTGGQMARNMWHCPACSATPIDIFISPFCHGDVAK